VKAGIGKKAPLVSETDYRSPDELWVTYDGLVRVCDDARRKGEEMPEDLAALWLQQHEAVNRYVMTSTDQFLNIRGGAGVGKTYFMERLVRASLDAGRPVALLAPYGEQSRVTLRSEAEKATRPEVAQAFRDANTVAWLLNKARFSPQFRESLRGADVYVDEASLLDNENMLGLIDLARESDARVIFQGDTQQLHAVGRGQPLAMLERELRFGMHVGRINVTRRQRSDVCAGYQCVAAIGKPIVDQGSNRARSRNAKDRDGCRTDRRSGEACSPRCKEAHNRCAKAR
jgi:hypothetical protein